MLIFFALACTLTWVTYPLTAPAINPYGPPAAALLVTALVDGRHGVQDVLGRLVGWQADLRWYALVLGLPVALTATATALNVLLGAPAPTADQLGRWPELLVLAPMMLVMGGAPEELGWRGYAQERLQASAPAVRAAAWRAPERSPGQQHPVTPPWALTSAGAAVVWHGPLFLTGAIQWSDVALLCMACVVLAWVYNGSGGSVLLVALLHATNNAVSGEFVSPMFAGVDGVRQGWPLVGVWAVAAGAVLLATGPALLSRRSAESLTPAAHPGR